MLRRLIRGWRDGRTKALRQQRIQSLLGRGESLRRVGDIERAKLCYAEILSIDDTVAAAHSELALLLTVLGRPQEALPHYRVAHALEPLTGGASESYVRVLLQNGDADEARRVAEASVERHPTSYESRLALGLAAVACNDYGRALTAFDQAVALRPDSADAHANRGIALQNLGRFDEAHEAYERALREHLDHPLARFHQSLAWLTTGDYARGWPAYETRLLDPALAPRPQHFPRWDGSSPAGRRLLVYGEQGLGDEIMFASCIPDLIHARARCVIECNPALHALFTRSFPGTIVYPADADKSVPEAIRAEGIEQEVPFGSLPLYYRPSAAAFPRREGYLRADPDRVSAWRRRLTTSGHILTVGISWQGGTASTRAALRSVPLEQWLPVLTLPGVRFVSLQYTRDAQQAVDAFRQNYGVSVAHWPEAIADYDETAALVSALDLTVSVCTSIVHLAGGLGRPVWVMVPRNPEWRYGHVGETMLWHPSARLFRQQQVGDWQPVISAVARALRERIASSTASAS